MTNLKEPKGFCVVINRGETRNLYWGIKFILKYCNINIISIGEKECRAIENFPIYNFKKSNNKNTCI